MVEGDHPALARHFFQVHRFDALPADGDHHPYSPLGDEVDGDPRIDLRELLHDAPLDLRVDPRVDAERELACAPLPQQRSGGRQVSAVEVKWGRLRLNSVALELADGTARKAAATLNGTPLAARTEQEGARLLVTFAEETVLEAEARLEIAVS